MEYHQQFPVPYEVLQAADVRIMLFTHKLQEYHLDSSGEIGKNTSGDTDDLSFTRKNWQTRPARWP